MFKFLKDKLKNAVKKFSKEVDEEAEEVVEETPIQEKTSEPVEKAAPKKESEGTDKEPAEEVAPDEVETTKESVEEKPAAPEKEKKKPLKKKEAAFEEVPEKKEEQEEVIEEKPAEEEPLPEEKEREDKAPTEKTTHKGFFSRLKEKLTSKKEEIEPEKEKESFEAEKDEELLEKTDEEDKKKAHHEHPQVTEGKKELAKEEKPKEQKKKSTAKEPIQPEEKTVPKKEPANVEDTHVPEEEPTTPKEEPNRPETPIKEEPEEKRGVFSFIKDKITKKNLSESKFEELFFDLEVAMLENNVAMEVIDKIKLDLRENLVDKPLPRDQIETKVIGSLTESIRSLFDIEQINIEERIKNKKPLVICFLGINGSGKTTSIAKIARMLLDKNHSVVLAAGDTFRAAAIDQLQLHADKLGVKLIRQDYGSDAAAVAFDAVKHAEAKGVDVVLIDTAGRMHSNVNLQDELKKIVRVAKPDLKIFVGEAITGNDCVEQATKFNESVGIDGIILTKADVDEKGGAFVSVSYITKKPILYMGMGQEYTDLKPFKVEDVMGNLGLA